MIFSSHQIALLSACCPLVVRFKSGQQADNKRTTSGQQPVLVRSKTLPDMYEVRSIIVIFSGF
jgi:hypothetical protein